MYKLGDKIIENCGNKAKFLSILKSKGYNIPLGVVIDFEEFKSIIKQQNLNFETIDKIEIPDELINRVVRNIPQGKLFAVRSSANIEDCRNISLAGRYLSFLNVPLNRESLKETIKNCFLSLYGTDNLDFYRKNKIDINKIEMSVIVQEMIESNVSGILFTINPTNGIDSQIVIEFSKGAGEVVSGTTVPERIVYDWIEEKYVEYPKINILGENAIRKIINLSLSLQQEIGFPIDVEFGVYDSKLYVFQVRPITKIEHKEIYSRYINNTDIVSRFMWSIDKKVVNNTMQKFFDTIKNINEEDSYNPLIIYKYSRVYWNLNYIKKVLENVPGYIERYVDDLFGVKIDYLDNGVENLLSKNKLNIIKRKNVIDIVLKQCVNTNEYREEKIEEINKYKARLEDLNTKEALKREILNLLYIFYDIKSVYIWQALIALMFKININDSLGFILNRTDINNLFIGIDNKYKDGPILHMWDSSRKIKNDSNRMKFFEENLDAEIFYLYRKDRENPAIKDFLTNFIDEFGYRSFDESDIVSKCYDEEILKVIKMYRDILELDDKYDSLIKLKQQNRLYEKTIEKTHKLVKKTQIKGIIKRIENAREYIRKENEIWDLVLIIQSTIRKYMLKLGSIYKAEYEIDNEEDIFYLDYIDIINDTPENMKNIINKNKIYYNSFKNYIPLQDIFPCSRPLIKMGYSKVYNGVGASFGKIEGRACIVNSKEELKNLRKSDILVTKYVDKDVFQNIDLSEVSGIVTEYGGMLCHLAINARENRIPCVVGIEDACNKIENKKMILVDGDTGEVKIK